MTRRDQYAAVNDRLWAQYNKLAPRTLARRLLHLQIFYQAGLFCDAPHRPCVPGFSWRLHPLAVGSIAPGYAVTEKHYVNLTRDTVRSERETEKTAAHARCMAL